MEFDTIRLTSPRIKRKPAIKRHEVSLHLASLSDVTDSELSVVGSKAHNLGIVAQLGADVPWGVVVKADLLKQLLHYDRDDLEEVARCYSKLIPLVNLEELDQSLARHRSWYEERWMSSLNIVGSLIIDMCKLQGLSSLAVRSSAENEDLVTLSHAGLYDTCLNVTVALNGLSSAMARCWSSLLSTRLLRYLAKTNSPWNDTLAIIVQEMIDAEIWGVLFTRHPLQNEADSFVVTAYRSSSSGSLHLDRVRIDFLINRSSGEVIVHDVVPSAGTVSVDQTQLVMDESLMHLSKLLFRIGHAIEMMSGFPQDIEWAYMSERCYVLQARPAHTEDAA